MYLLLLYIFFLFLVNYENSGNCTFDSGCILSDLSCRLIHHFNVDDTFELQMFDNESLAFEATKQGTVWGYIGFHENFTAAFVSRMSDALKVSPTARNQSTAQVR